MVEAILSSDVVVADLTGRNPNVFYELGLAHATRGDVVMTTQEDSIPFDVSTERAILYKPTRHGLEKLKRELAEQIPAATPAEIC